MVVKEILFELIASPLILFVAIWIFKYYWYQLRIPALSSFKDVFLQSESLYHTTEIDDLAHYLAKELECRVITDYKEKVCYYNFKNFENKTFILYVKKDGRSVKFYTTSEFLNLMPSFNTLYKERVQKAVEKLEKTTITHFDI